MDAALNFDFRHPQHDHADAARRQYLHPGTGGQAPVGSTSAPPAIVDASGNVKAGPGTQGILTLEQGDINIFTDRSVLLAQSRIFMWPARTTSQVQGKSTVAPTTTGTGVSKKQLGFACL
jgi:hypothetical protein